MIDYPAEEDAWTIQHNPLPGEEIYGDSSELFDFQGAKLSHLLYNVHVFRFARVCLMCPRAVELATDARPWAKNSPMAGSRCSR